MKRYLLTFLMVLLAIPFAKAQISFNSPLAGQQNDNPVEWTFSQEKLSDTEYLLIFKGKIAPKWHVYSQNNPKGGALPMVITYTTTEGIEMVGESQEEGLQKTFNDVFGVDELFFEKEIKITQKVKITDPNVKHIKGNIFCQACIDVCINLKEDFVFSLDGLSLIHI